MPNKRISELSSETSIGNADYLPLIRYGSGEYTNVKVAVSTLSSTISSTATLSNLAALTSSSFSSSIVCVRLAGYSTAGDGGEALWIRSDNEPTHSIKTRDALGNWWQIAERRVRPEMWGAVGAVAGNPTSDSAPAIQALIDYLSDTGGGILDCATGRSYGLYTAAAGNGSALILKQTVTLEMLWPSGDRRPSSGGAIDWRAEVPPYFPGFVVDFSVVTYGLTTRPNSMIRCFAGRSRHLTKSPKTTTAACQQWAQDMIATMDSQGGTFIRIGSGGGEFRGNDVRIENVFVVGAAIGVASGAVLARAHINTLVGDCTSILKTGSAGDGLYFCNVHTFPFITINGGASVITWDITTFSNNGGKVQITLDAGAADATYLRVGDKVVLQEWVGVADPLVYSGHLAVSTGGGAANFTSGRKSILSIEGGSPYKITLDMTWASELSSATAVLAVIPGHRDGIAMNMGAGEVHRATVKGQAVGYYINGQNCLWLDPSYEPAGTGDGDAADVGTVAVWIGSSTSRTKIVGGGLKSAGRIFVHENDDGEGTVCSAVHFSKGDLYTIDLRAGVLQLDCCVITNGAPTVRIGPDVGSSQGVWVWGGHVPVPTLSVDSGSSIDPYSRWHGHSETGDGGVNHFAMQRFRKRESNRGGGLQIFSINDVAIHNIAVGEDSGDDAAAMRIGGNRQNNTAPIISFGLFNDATTALTFNLDAVRADTSAANGDLLVLMGARGRNSDSGLTRYSRIEHYADDITFGAEDGRIDISVIVNGTLRRRIRIDENGTLLSPPGPYADDTAASAAGVAVGELYRVTGGTLAWRQT